MPEATGTITIRSPQEAFLLKTALNALYGLAPILGLHASEETADEFDEIGNHLSEQIRAAFPADTIEEWMRNETGEMQQLLGKANKQIDSARLMAEMGIL